MNEDQIKKLILVLRKTLNRVSLPNPELTGLGAVAEITLGINDIFYPQEKETLCGTFWKEVWK